MWCCRGFQIGLRLRPWLNCEAQAKNVKTISISGHVRELFCFHYTACSDDLPKTYGWDFFSLEEEYVRQGVPNKYWSKSDVNSKYQVRSFLVSEEKRCPQKAYAIFPPRILSTIAPLEATIPRQICDTYPSILFVPSNVSDSQLVECSRFRSKGRLPVLTYFNKTNGAAITR